MCAPKPSYKTERGCARWSIQGRRHNTTQARAHEQHERKGGARENNAAINTTGRGKGGGVCAHEAELQDRKGAHTRINTGPAGDTMRRKRERMSKQKEGGTRGEQRSNQRKRVGEGRRKYVCVHKARATKRCTRLNGRRQQTICPMRVNSSTKHDNQQR